MIKRSTVLLTLIWLALVLLLQARPLDDFDTLTQIQLGRLILEAKSVAIPEVFSYPLSNCKLPNPGWLAQVLFAWLFSLGGLSLLKLCSDACLAGVIVWVTSQAAANLKQKPNQGTRLVAIALSSLTAFFTVASNSSVRPQVIALGCFGWLLGTILKPKIGFGQVAKAALAMLLWQNAHPSLTLGLLLLAVVLFARLSTPQTQRTTKELQPLLLLSILTIVLQFATPQGASVFETNRRNLEAARHWLGVSEWVPAWKPIVRQAMIPFWLLFAGTLALVARYIKRLKREEILLFAAFSALSIYAARFAMFFALANIPLWLRLLHFFWPAGIWAWQDKACVSRKFYAPAASIFFALVCLFKLRAAPDFGRDYPGGAILKLKSILPEGRIYNYREWAGGLIWEMPGKWQVAIDGRLYLYDRAKWLEYNNAALGRIEPQILAERDKIDAFFLRKSFQAGLIERLAEENAWARCFEDELTVIYCKRVARSLTGVVDTKQKSAGPTSVK